MKQNLLLISALFVGATAFAQFSSKGKVSGEERSATLTQTDEVGKKSRENSSDYSSGQQDGLGVVIFEEDFASGIPSTWSNVSLSSGNEKWEYRGPSTTPSNAVGSRGAYVGSLGPIQSTTRTNGFVIFDSDWWDNGGTAGGTGQQSASAHNGALTTPAFDCSSYTAVVLTFESYLRNFNSNHWILVSSDGFITADTIYNISDDYGTNEMSPVDEKFRLDISAAAAGQPNVQVRFLYQSITTNSLPPGYYFWMIDDIKVMTPADWDVALDDAFYQGVGNTFFAVQNDQLPNRIPLEQIKAQGVLFGAGITSWSEQTQMNVTLQSTVYEGANVVFDTTSAPINMSGFSQSDSVNVLDVFYPSAETTYEVVLTVYSDSTEDLPADNSLITEFTTTENIYAYHDDQIDGGVSWSSGTHSMFQVFDIYDQDSVAAVHVALYSSGTFTTDPGSGIEVGIWPITGYSGGGPVVDFASPVASKIYEVQVTDLHTLFRVPFDSPTAITPGQYMVGYRYQTGVIRTAYSDVDNGSLRCWVDVDSDGAIDGFAEYNPLISLETYSAAICESTIINPGFTVTCDLENYEAEITADVTTNGNTQFTYKWNDGSTADSIIVTEEGTYSYTVTDGNFCSADTVIVLTNADFNCNLSVDEINDESSVFSVMPNPSHGVFNLVFNSNIDGAAEVSIHSLKGDLVYSNRITRANSGTQLNIDLSNLDAGVYFIQVRSDNHTNVGRVVIE
ncbi:MAG: hypothetical protein Kow0075_12100 [Salibacteraceae bacterium]